MAVLPRVLCREENQHQLPDLGLPGLPGVQPRRAPSREDGRGAGGGGKTMATRVPAGRSSAVAIFTMRRETGALLAHSSCQGRPLPPPRKADRHPRGHYPQDSSHEGRGRGDCRAPSPAELPWCLALASWHGAPRSHTPLLPSSTRDRCLNRRLGRINPSRKEQQ